MNDIEFIETLKQKRNACDYSQSRLAQELQISRQNLNEIENGKTKASKEMKHILLHYLDYCNCTQPFTLTIDYLRVRFPTTDALEIIKNVLAMKSEYFIHEDYGMYGYEEQYVYGDISVNASKDSSMGVLLELRGMGCRNLEYVLQARGIDWYYFLSSCIDYQGVFKRIDLAVNDMGGLLDIEILRERYYANKVWKRSRTHEAVDSGKLSGTHGDTAKTFYIGSKNSSIYFCLYEKEKEQKSKGIKTDIKNRFEIRLKNGKAEQTIEQLVFSRNPEQTIANLILTQIDFPDYILWDIFLDNVTTSLPFIMTPVAVNMDKTKRWLERQVMEHQVYRDRAQGVILDAYGKMVVEECKKFDEKTKQKIHDYIQQQVTLNPVEQLKQDGKIRLEHYQKFYQNGTYERSRESGTEANYDMVDGLVNNQKKNPEKIFDACSNKQTSRNEQDNKPKKRRSVIKRLHQKQIAIARRSGKPIPKYLDQEMERKRG